jgi:hypothetical protein
MNKYLTWLINITLVAVFLIGIHAGFTYARPHYKFKIFKNDADSVLRFEIKGMHDLKAKLLKAAADRGLPCTEKDILVEITSENRYKIKIDYDEYVDYFGYLPKTFNFKLDLYR